jgi:hypothetical protein
MIMILWMMLPSAKTANTSFHHNPPIQYHHQGDETQHLYMVSPTNLQLLNGVYRAKFESVEVLWQVVCDRGGVVMDC